VNRLNLPRGTGGTASTALSPRQVQDLAFERGINICHETPESQGCAHVSEAFNKTRRSTAVDRDGSAPVAPGGDEYHWRQRPTGMRAVGVQVRCRI